VVENLAIHGWNGLKGDAPYSFTMPAVGFRFRAYADQRTLGALRAQLRLACEIHNSLRRADIDLHRGNGRGLTLTELRQLALDLRKRNEGYQQLYSQVVQEIADRFHGARRRFREGVLQARIREPRSEAGRRGSSSARPAAGGPTRITTRPSTR
jgi:putative transposase